jgi:hypothetical protein
VIGYEHKEFGRMKSPSPTTPAKYAFGEHHFEHPDGTKVKVRSPDWSGVTKVQVHSADGQFYEHHVSSDGIVQSYRDYKDHTASEDDKAMVMQHVQAAKDHTPA